MKSTQRRHTIELIFPLTCILVFCLCAMILILGGTDFYKKTVQGLKENYTIRTAVPYIQEKCREYNNVKQTEVIDGPEGKVLAFYKTVREKEYATYIYYMDGYLRELYTKKSAEAQWEAGQKLVALEAFSLEWSNPCLMKITVEAEGQQEVFYLSLGDYGEDVQ